MKQHSYFMQKLCGAKCRTTGGQPCQNYAMQNGRCRMHGGRSTGPRTSEGKLRKALSSVTTGLWTKEAKQARKESHLALSNGKTTLEDAQRQLEL